MKVSINGMLFVLLVATLAVGCTVNIQTTPREGPSPPPTEEETNGPLVNPTSGRPEPREQPVRRDSAGRVEPTGQPIRRTTDAIFTRREEPPTQGPDSAKIDDESRSRRESEDKAPDNDRRGNPNDPGVQATDTTGKADDPPDRPGVGRGRDESKEEYPGGGNATGLRRQEERPSTGMKPDENADSRVAQGERQPQANLPPATARQSGADRRPDSQTEDSRAGGAAPDIEHESRLETGDLTPGPVLGIRTQDLPAPGKCRLWMRGLAVDDQAKAGKCEEIEATAPAGSWVLYRPARQRDIVHVRIMDLQQVGVVSTVLSYETASGRLIGEAGQP